MAEILVLDPDVLTLIEERRRVLINANTRQLYGRRITKWETVQSSLDLLWGHYPNELAAVRSKYARIAAETRKRRAANIPSTANATPTL